MASYPFPRSRPCRLQYSKLEDRNLLAADVAPLVDINPTVDASGSSDPTEAIEFDGSAYFIAESLGNGRELYRSDGTEAGTQMVRDFYPGPRDGVVSTGEVLNGELHFLALDTDNTIGLWSTDGTAFTKIKSIGPAFEVAGGDMQVVGSKLYFAVDDGVHGEELWESDGTEEGTVLAADIRDGAEGSSLDLLTSINDLLYFTADDGVHGKEIWVHDTSTSQLTLLDIHPGSATSDPRNPVSFNDQLIFIAHDNDGRWFWTSDGTSNGTTRMTSATNFNFDLHIEFNDQLYFRGFSNKLWRTDGTDSGTMEVNADVKVVGQLVEFDGRLYFYGRDDVGAEPYYLDSSDNVHLLQDIFVGGSSSIVSNFHQVNGLTYFTARHASGEYSLWRVSGSSAIKVRDMPAETSNFNLLLQTDTQIFMEVNSDAAGSELWIHGLASTTLIMDIGSEAISSNPDYLHVINGNALFRADDGTLGRELWTSDGTVAGTQLLQDINPTGNSFDANGTVFSSEVVATDSLYFFTARDTDTSTTYSLWRSDGTEFGTIPLLPLTVTDPEGLSIVGNELYFTSIVDGVNTIWKSDGTESGTVPVVDVPEQIAAYTYDFVEQGDRIYFVSRFLELNFGSLYWIDKTTGETSNAGKFAWDSRNRDPTRKTIFTFNDELYFFSEDIELHRYDEATGTSELIAETGFTSPFSQPIFELNEEAGLFFFTGQGKFWVSDGTAAQTAPLVDPAGDAILARPSDIEAFEDGVVFLRFLSEGNQLWWSDGTAAGSYALSELFDASSFAHSDSISVQGDRIYFVANDGLSGESVWASDGTADSAQPIFRIGDTSYPTVSNDFENVVQFADLGESLLFTGKTNSYGLELYSLHYPTSLDIDSAEVFENQNACFVVGTLSAEDLDSAEHAFSLVEGENDTHNHLFKIVGDSLMTVEAVDFEQNSELSIRVAAIDTEGFRFEKELLINVLNVPELVAAPSIGDDTGQRSRIDKVTLTIDAVDVDIQPGAFGLIQRGSDIAIPVTFQTSINGDGNTEVVLGFSGDLTRAQGALLDGFYELTIDASQITSNGYALDLDGDTSTSDSLVIGDQESDGFFARYGDWSGDGILNVFDLLEFRKTYALNPGEAGYNAALDFDTNGVGIFDLLEFRKRFGKPAMTF